jgi:hypothetical protein
LIWTTTVKPVKMIPLVLLHPGARRLGPPDRTKSADDRLPL